MRKMCVLIMVVLLLSGCSSTIPSTINEIKDPDAMMMHLQDEADRMAPTMRFLVSVCVSIRYKDSMKPVLDCVSCICQSAS